MAKLRHLRDNAPTPREWLECDLSLHRVEAALENTREAVREVERTRRDRGDDE